MHASPDRSWPTRVALILVCGCQQPSEAVVDCDAPGPTKLLELPRNPITPGGFRDERGWLLAARDDTHFAWRHFAVECGKAPRIFAEELSNVFRIDERGPWLGTTASTGATAGGGSQPVRNFLLDPWGDASPRELPPLLLGITDEYALFGENTDEGPSLWRARLGATFELERMVLDLPNSFGHPLRWVGPAFATYQVELLFVRASDDASEITLGLDPQTGAVRFTEPGRLIASRLGGRIIILRNGTNDDPYQYAVVDTSDPVNRIDPLPIGWQCCNASHDLIAAYSVHEPPQLAAETHLILLPNLQEVRLEGHWLLADVRGTTGDERRILAQADGYYLLEPNSSTPVHLYPTLAKGRIADDALWLSHRTQPYLPDAWNFDLTLVAVPLDGSPPVTVLEPPLSDWLPLSDARWALQRGHVDFRSDLRIFDSATGREEIVLDDVDPGISSLNGSGLWPSSHPEAPAPMPLDGAIIFARSTSDETTIWRFPL